VNAGNNGITINKIFSILVRWISGIDGIIGEFLMTTAANNIIYAILNVIKIEMNDKGFEYPKSGKTVLIINPYIRSKLIPVPIINTIFSGRSDCSKLSI
jgi:predicted transglutaminase-like protease